MVHSITKYLISRYVSDIVASQMCDTINWKISKGKYDPGLNADEFAYEITRDLRRISNDEHISVMRPLYKDFDEPTLNNKFERMSEKQRKKFVRKVRKRSKKTEANYKKRTKDDMFTYGDIKILPGNIGYIEIKDFKPTSYNKKQNKGRISIAAAMKFLCKTKSIIIDLRDNQGGFVNEAARFCSYFSSSASNYFISIEWHFRYDSSGIQKELSGVEKIFTSKSIDNSQTQSKKIYILISRRTFSAAELSVYKIKQFNPETVIIGEKTKGGGNGYSEIITNEYFSAIIPNFKAFDQNNSNYTLESKGITPDLFVSADSALDAAYKLAQIHANPDQTKVKYFKSQNKIVLQNQEHFKKYYADYSGHYRKIQIFEEAGKLYMLYDTYIKIQLLPTAVDYFSASQLEAITFLRDAGGHVTAIRIKHTNECIEEFRRQ